MSKIPFFFSLAISAVLLPSISRATKAKNDNRVQDIVVLESGANRVTALLCRRFKLLWKF